MTTTLSKFERFSRGEALSVAVDRIETELTALWREASLGTDDHLSASHAIARAALWNIVIPTRGVVALAQIKTMIGALAPAIPARVIVLGRSEASRSGAIRSTIASNVVSRPNGARIVCSEEITLMGPRRSEERFGALVRALQIPSLPTATFSIDSPVLDALVVKDLLPLSDRLVVDTGRCEHPDELAVLHRQTADGVPELSDLDWLRLSSFRLLFAGLFDPPVGGQPLRDATRVTIEYQPPRVSSALLLGSWLAGQLGWKPLGARRSQDGRLRFPFTPSDPAATSAVIELCLCPSDRECGPSGIVAIEVRSAAGPAIDAPRAMEHELPPEAVYSVRHTQHNHAVISVPIAPPRTVKLDSRSEAELCVGALGPSGRDPQLRQALATAAELADRLAERVQRN